MYAGFSGEEVGAGGGFLLFSYLEEKFCGAVFTLWRHIFKRIKVIFRIFSPSPPSPRARVCVCVWCIRLATSTVANCYRLDNAYIFTLIKLPMCAVVRG